jgi:hypothetical protein
MAIAAIFGALAMITTGLGLALPGYLPLVNFELQGTYITIATMAAGPIAGMIVSFLVSLVSAVGVISFPFYFPHILVLAAFYPAVYKIKRVPVRFAVFWVVSALALFIQYWGWWWLYAAVFKIMSVEAMFYYNMFAGPYVIYLLIWALIPSIVLLTTPGFVRPDWHFPMIKWIALIASIISITLGVLWWR